MQLQGDLVMKKIWIDYQIEIHFQIKPNILVKSFKWGSIRAIYRY